MPSDKIKVHSNVSTLNNNNKDKEKNKGKKKSYGNRKRKDTLTHKDAKDNKIFNNRTKEFTFKKPFSYEYDCDVDDNHHGNKVKRDDNFANKNEMCHVGIQTMRPLIIEIDKIFQKEELITKSQNNNYNNDNNENNDDDDLDWTHLDQWNHGLGNAYNDHSDTDKERKWSQTSTICENKQYEYEPYTTNSSSEDLVQLELELEYCHNELEHLGQSLAELQKYVIDVTQH